MSDVNNIELDSLLDNSFVDRLFDYSADEVKEFHSGFDKSYLPTLYNSVSKALKAEKAFNNINERQRVLIDFLRNLTSDDLKVFESTMSDFTETSPNMLWNMLNKIDRKFYKTPERFHDWISTLDDNTFDNYIARAADGKPLHNPSVYEVLTNKSTKVEILDGYIAISSSNLKALEKFKDRLLFSNTCDFEHRIKKHKGVTIHSYIFNMNKQNSN